MQMAANLITYVGRGGGRFAWWTETVCCVSSAHTTHLRGYGVEAVSRTYTLRDQLGLVRSTKSKIEDGSRWGRPLRETTCLFRQTFFLFRLSHLSSLVVRAVEYAIAETTKHRLAGLRLLGSERIPAPLCGGD